jgi:hypothetical protein
MTLTKTIERLVTACFPAWLGLTAAACNPASDPDGFAVGMTAVGVIVSIVVTVVSVASPIAIMVVVFGMLAKNKKKRDAVLSQGETANALVLKIWQTGLTVNDNPQVGILLQVEPQGRQPYQAQIDPIVPIIQLPRIQPGLRVPVKIDRMQPLSVVLDLDRPIDPSQLPAAGAPQQPLVRCTYCGSPYTRGLARCPSCGGPGIMP